MDGDEQRFLLEIVKKWRINPIPEYRGFRCGCCQKYITRAWHHLLATGGFLCPVHLCESCEGLFRSGEISFRDAPTQNRDLPPVDFSYRSTAINQFEKIRRGWRPTGA